MSEALLRERIIHVLTALDSIRLYVIEGQVLFAKALCQVFASERNIEIVGDSQTINEQAIAKARPDVVNLDLEGGLSGVVESLELCRRAVPDAKICALSMRPAPEIMNRCLSAGAEGYIIK